MMNDREIKVTNTGPDLHLADSV